MEEKPIEAKESKEEITPKLLCDLGIAISFAQGRRAIATMKEPFLRNLVEAKRKNKSPRKT